MKKFLRVLCMVLVLSMLLTPLCFAEDNYDTLADWDLKVKVPEGKTAVLKGNQYYIYGQRTGEIPYVMIMAYHYESEEKFITDFTASMQRSYADLKVTKEAARVTIGDKNGWEIDYGYTVSGYQVADRRIIMKVGDWVYMFASKEIAELKRTLGTMLDDVVADCVFLSENGSGLEALEEEEIEFSPAYLYCLSNGTPKYWIDLSGKMADTIVLHCFFRSSEATFYESVFYLDLTTAEKGSGRIVIHDVTDERGYDVSEWFKSLTLTFKGKQLTMTVKRDDKTLAGGAEDNILSGSYKMTPAGYGVSYQYRQEDGMLKYWLDLGGEDVVLHAMFRSGDPDFYEEIFILDVESAEEGEYSLDIKKVYNEAGIEVSKWFKSLTLTSVQGAVMMNVQRDEKTLAGGADDNILTGVYLFEPRTYLLPAHNGPYTEKELGQWAQIYYFEHNGFFPPKADVTRNADGSFTVHLYEVVKQGGVTHTATSAWYTVDAYGSGTDDITGRSVELCR